MDKQEKKNAIQAANVKLTDLIKRHMAKEPVIREMAKRIEARRFEKMKRDVQA